MEYTYLYLSHEFLRINSRVRTARIECMNVLKVFGNCHHFVLQKYCTNWSSHSIVETCLPPRQHWSYPLWLILMLKKLIFCVFLNVILRQVWPKVEPQERHKTSKVYYAHRFCRGITTYHAWSQGEVMGLGKDTKDRGEEKVWAMLLLGF